MDDEDWRFRSFTLRGSVYGPKVSVSKHTVYWAIRNSESDDMILIDEIVFEEDSSAAN